jgi:hypothetical protein
MILKESREGAPLVLVEAVVTSFDLIVYGALENEVPLSLWFL